MASEKLVATWKPYARQDDHAVNSKDDLPESAFAFPKQRKEPMTDETHVRNALARFNQVENVSDEDRELAFANIRKAAAYYGVQISEDNWRDLGRSPV